MSPALEIKDLSLSIGDAPILDRINLTLHAGNITGLVGRSGSGKSMTALAAMRLTPHGSQLSGAIKLSGGNLLEKSESEMCAIRGRDITMIFQEPMTALNPLHMIGAQVAETILIHSGSSKQMAFSEAQQILVRVGLPPDEIPPTRFPHELSGGQRQRVMIAIAIAMKPKILIADEPTTALDVTTQAEILALLQRLVKEDSIALLLITHNLAVISNIADRMAVIKDGAIVAQGPPESFFQDGLNDDVNGLVAHPIVRNNKSSNTIKPPVILEAQNVIFEYALPRQSIFSPAVSLRAVDNVSFSLRQGENLGLVGESGCGKSTLARALLGLHPITQGRINIDGEIFPSTDKTAMRRMRRKIQIVFQDPYSSFNPRQKIEKVIAEPFHLFDEPLCDTEKNERVADTLAAVGLAPHYAHKFPHEFSGGQRQRIAIARALITKPEIIILDEATSALDITSRNRILELLMALSDQRGVSFLFITHDLSVIRDVTDRVLVMKRGCIIEENTTSAIFNAPAHEYTKALIKAAPVLKWPLTASA